MAVSVLCLFPQPIPSAYSSPWVGLQCVIVAFPGYAEKLMYNGHSQNDQIWFLRPIIA